MGGDHEPSFCIRWLVDVECMWYTFFLQMPLTLATLERKFLRFGFAHKRVAIIGFNWHNGGQR